MKFYKNQSTFKLGLIILTFLIALNLISTFKFSSLLLSNPKNNNSKINKYLSQVYKYFKSLDKFHKSEIAIDCNHSKSCMKVVNKLIVNEDLTDLEFLFFKIYMYLNGLFNKFPLDNFNYDMKMKDDNGSLPSDDFFIRFCDIIKFLKISEENVFFLYSNELYMYIDKILTSNNFKDTLKNKYLKHHRDEPRKLNLYSKRIVLLIKLITAYINKYSTEKVKDEKTIYRGVRINKDDPILNIQTNSKKCNVLVSPSPLSFSYDKSIAEKHLKLTEDTDYEVSVIFEIKDTQNCLGKNLDNKYLTNNINKEEYLLKPFSHLKIVSMSDEEDRKLVVLKCLKDDKKIENIKNIHLMK